MTSVHPLKYECAVKALERSVGEPVKVIEELVREGLLLKVPYMGDVFLLIEIQRTAAQHVSSPLLREVAVGGAAIIRAVEADSAQEYLLTLFGALQA